jgi:acetyl-CoA C-acetyltransferase
MRWRDYGLLPGVVDRNGVHIGRVTAAQIDPYGMSGARLTGHALIEGAPRRVRHAIVTMCIGGRQGAAALLEIA